MIVPCFSPRAPPSTTLLSTIFAERGLLIGVSQSLPSRERVREPPPRSTTVLRDCSHHTEAEWIYLAEQTTLLHPSSLLDGEHCCRPVDDQPGCTAHNPAPQSLITSTRRLGWRGKTAVTARCGNAALWSRSPPWWDFEHRVGMPGYERACLGERWVRVVW